MASDLEVDPCQRYDLDRTVAINWRRGLAADQQMNWWLTDTDRRKERGLRPDRAQGAPAHEAKEHHLPLVRQRRA
jgi:hypothetical protein